MLQAAMPYLQPEAAGTIELLVKLDELSECMGRPPADISGCASSFRVDLEGMLQAIRPFCNQREREFLDRIQNIFMLRNLMSMMDLMKQKGDKADNMWDILAEQLSNEQKQQFEMMQMFMTMMNTSDSEGGDSTDR